MRVVQLLLTLVLLLAVGIAVGWSGVDRTVTTPVAPVRVDELHDAAGDRESQVEVGAPPVPSEREAAEPPVLATPRRNWRARPPVGGLLVRFVDGLGAPVAVEGRLRWSTFLRDDRLVPQGTCEVTGTSAQVEWSDDCERVSLHFEEPGRLVVEREVVLPAGARDLEAVMRRGELSPRLEIPLVDGNGRPVVEGEFRVHVPARPGRPASSATRASPSPDARGVLSVELRDVGAGDAEVACSRQVDCAYCDTDPSLPPTADRHTGPHGESEAVIAIRHFPDIAPGSVHRVEPVIVPTPQPAVRGTVVDGDGRPVGGMRMLLTTVDGQEPSALSRVSTITDDDGRFVVNAVGRLPPGTMIVGRAAGSFCAPTLVPSVGESLLLTARPTGSIEVPVRFEPPVAEMPSAMRRQFVVRGTLFRADSPLPPGYDVLSRVRMWFLPAGEEPGAVKSAVARRSGTLWLGDLVPAEYELDLSMGNNPLGERLRVVVRAGETARPLPGGLTLGDTIEATCVRVLDERGEAVAGASVTCRLAAWAARRPEGLQTHSNPRGEVWFLAPRGALADVDVVHRGHAPSKVVGCTLPAEIVLGHGTAVECAIGGLEAVPDAASFVVSLTDADAADGDAPRFELQILGAGIVGPVRGPSATLDATGAGRLVNLSAGRYRVWLIAMPKFGSVAEPRFVPLGELVLGERPGEQVTFARQLTVEQARTLRGE